MEKKLLSKTVRDVVNLPKRFNNTADSILPLCIFCTFMLVLAFGFALDVTKNIYIKQGYKSIAQRAVQEAVKEVDSRGNVLQTAANRVVDAYVREKANSEFKYDSEICSTVRRGYNIVENNIRKTSVKNRKTPFIIIHLKENTRTPDNNNNSVVESNGTSGNSSNTGSDVDGFFDPRFRPGVINLSLFSRGIDPVLDDAPRVEPPSRIKYNPKTGHFTGKGRPGGQIILYMLGNRAATYPINASGKWTIDALHIWKNWNVHISQTYGDYAESNKINISELITDLDQPTNSVEPVMYVSEGGQPPRLVSGRWKPGLKVVQAQVYDTAQNFLLNIAKVGEEEYNLDCQYFNINVSASKFGSQKELGKTF